VTVTPGLAAGTVFQTVLATPAGGTTVHLRATDLDVGSRPPLGENPQDARDAARALAREFSEHVEALKAAKPNDPDRLSKHNELVALFERMASGLAQLADAIDRAIGGAADGKPEPVLLGEAAKIAKQLHLALMEWVEENRTTIVEVPIRLGLFALGIEFLHSISADGIAAVTALTTLILKRPGAKTKATGKKGRGNA
jgi:hypothetical protein